jgi:hypothetical protein
MVGTNAIVSLAERKAAITRRNAGRVRATGIADGIEGSLGEKSSADRTCNKFDQKRPSTNCELLKLKQTLTEPPK